MTRISRWRVAGWRRVAVVALLAAVLPLVAAGCRCSGRGGGPARRGPAVVVVDPDELVRASAAPEQEPNDERRQAQELELEKPVGGTLSARTKDGGRDQDWYRIPVEVNRILEASLSGIAAADLVLEAFSAEGKRLVKVNNHGEGGGEALVNLAVGPGRYYLRVTSRPPTSAAKVGSRAAGNRVYRISYKLRDREPGEELEPNWKAPWASELALGGEAVGFLGWHTDTDWYRVTLGERAPGALLRVEFDGVDGVRAQVAVRDGDSSLIQRRSGGAGDPVVLANLAVPPTTDTVFVEVRCGRQANVENQYALRVSARVPPRQTELEPNDAAERATPVSIGKIVVGNLADNQDRDLFRVVDGGAVRVVVSPPAGVDVALAVVDQAGKVLREVNAAPAGKSETLPAARLGPERLLRVRAPRGNDADPLGVYRLLVRRRPEVGQWEAEPNDAREQASAWREPAEPLRGFLYPEADVDHIEIACPSTARTLRVTGKRRPKSLALIGPDGKEVTTANRVDGDGGLSMSLSPVAAGGRCWLRLSEGAGGVPADDSYLLSMTPSPAP